MLTSLRVVGGYPAKLPALKDQKFKFGRGLTILFGQNASGKSTMLRLLATYSGAKNGGWSTLADDISFGDPPPYPERFGKKEVEAVIKWDGTPTFYASGPPAKGQSAFDQALELGGEEADDFFGRMFAPGSAGQEQIHWFNRLEAKLASPPQWTYDTEFYLPGHGKIRMKNVNEVWQEKIKSFVDYTNSLKRTGMVSVLLDEPDAHMSLPNQMKVWTVAFPRIAKSHQTIIATHSPFALVAPDATIIDLSPNGYADQCRSALRKAFS